ncbi:Interferon-induced protein with tetratricopeptide repeats 2 [Tupaia chinensis]|uniref:Interferon-induced protein with tetratricopeptide repeats 2 n=2 Tax=Tupaia chinensis TaxID=246437 RepID=L9KZV7_TUPCH|nr:Interferon-induced protein with tetratricopeptide repeats 2 [Tupaia chinensis]
MRSSLESSLRQLKCHFTWNLMKGESSLEDFEDRVLNQCEFQSSDFRATVCNILAYLEHHRGQHEAALEHLRQAEDLIQQQHADHAELRSLVTWGNYAWVYYHMGQLSEAQLYLDKVKRVCEKFSSPYRIESPEMDCEEGWARLKCGGNQNERAKVCFEKALEKQPMNPEFSSGLAIATYRLDSRPPPQDPIDSLRRAIRLNPDNQFVKVLLALKLQKMNEESEAERLVEEALEKVPRETDVLRCAARFYRYKEALDQAIDLLKEASERMPPNAYLYCRIGCCYRAKVLQTLHRGEDRRYGKRARLPELIGQAVDYLKKADEANGNLYQICSFLAGLYSLAGRFEEAEYYFQKEFSKELTPAEKQMLHLRYGSFQLYEMKCEEKAIYHFTEGMKISQGGSKQREKIRTKLEKIAQARLYNNEADSVALHLLAFLQEMKSKEAWQNDADARRRLDAGKRIPSTSLAETENEK